jgi:hypothetical protein
MNPLGYVNCRLALSDIGRPPSAVERPASAVTPPSSQLVGCSVASLTPSTSLASLPFPSHMPDSLRISVGDSALYCNRTVAPHSIVGCRVARLPASDSQPEPLPLMPLVASLRLLVVLWHHWPPPFVGCCLWPPFLSHLTRLRLSAAAAAGGCRRELSPPKPRPRPLPAIVIAISPSSPHWPGSG